MVHNANVEHAAVAAEDEAGFGEELDVEPSTTRGGRPPSGRRRSSRRLFQGATMTTTTTSAALTTTTTSAAVARASRHQTPRLPQLRASPTSMGPRCSLTRRSRAAAR
jgi:hypothetical protein